MGSKSWDDKYDIKNTLFLLLRSYNFTRTELNGTGHCGLEILCVYSHLLMHNK